MIFCSFPPPEKSEIYFDMTDYLALGYYTPGDETYIVLGQDNMYSCSICGYQANKKQRIQYH